MSCSPQDIEKCFCSSVIFVIKLRHVLSLFCSGFIPSEQKNAVYRFLMHRDVIKIPVHLPRLRSMSHAGPL